MGNWKRAIAIDFDGTLCKNEYPDIGEPNWNVIYEALQEQKHGAGLILWTCREGNLLYDALEACAEWGLYFDAINDSLPEWKEHFGTTPRKIGADEYWDDKAVLVRSGELIDGRVELTTVQLVSAINQLEKQCFECSKLPKDEPCEGCRVYDFCKRFYPDDYKVKHSIGELIDNGECE